MNFLNKSQCILISLVALVVFSTNGIAQQQADKSDTTGTNPINFTRDFRVYNEYIWLNTAGDGNQNLTTLEFRTPFAGGKWQLNKRVANEKSEISTIKQHINFLTPREREVYELVIKGYLNKQINDIVAPSLSTPAIQPYRA